MEGAFSGSGQRHLDARVAQTACLAILLLIALSSVGALADETDVPREILRRIYQEYVNRAEVIMPLPAPRAPSIATAQQTTPEAQQSGSAMADTLPGQPVTIIRIGHSGPLTGAMAAYGRDDENGVRFALDEANARAIRIGGKPVRFELVSIDDQADPQLAASTARKLVDAGVAGVIGHLNSGISIPASIIYNETGLPMISGASTNPKLTEQGLRTVFRTSGRDDMQGRALAVFIVRAFKPKKVAVVYDSTAYGAILAFEVALTVSAADVPVMLGRVDDRTTDFTEILAKIKEQSPDVVFYGGIDTTAGPLLKRARELGIEATFTFGDGACVDDMAQFAGAAAEGLVCSQTEVPLQMISREFVDAFEAKYGEVKRYAPYFYDAAKILTASMQKADSAEPSKYLPALAETSFDGATGHIEFDRKGDRKDAAMTIYQLSKGRLEPIAIVKPRS